MNQIYDSTMLRLSDYTNPDDMSHIFLQDVLRQQANPIQNPVLQRS